MKNVNSGISIMVKRCSITFILLILFCADITAQKSRTQSLGGLSFSIIDTDEMFDPFELGGNPAWLLNNEKKQLLEISPSLSNTWGNYRRAFSPEGIMSYDAGFVGIKPLGTSGTFRGSAHYDYEIRRNNYRTLKKDTYAGEAFYFNDTTSGDHRYNGPTFEFMHSLELFNNFYFGAAARYKITDGLKKVYSFAQTLYRNVSGDIGAAYSFNENLSFGLMYSLFDEQEQIEASDVNLLTVQTYHYRGDTYSLELRGSSQKYKLKKEGNRFSCQFYLKSQKFELGMDGRYTASNTSVLFPVSSIIDTEDGYADFETFDIKMKFRYILSDRTTLGLISGFIKNNSWSKNSKRNLLLWEWETESYYAGLGGSYFILPEKFLLGAEYVIQNAASDSLKYVDNKSSYMTSFDHIIKAGLEFHLSEYISIRGGYNHYFLEHDFIDGGDKVNINLFTLGCGFYFLQSINIDAGLEYSNIGLRENSEIKRNRWGGFFTLRFFSF